uniref:C2H2-type domain-containing protein n=1 Tax=Romanomermis culicivorax TaxID=13658 RepID=A0A915IPQ9_ROMCU
MNEDPNLPSVKNDQNGSNFPVNDIGGESKPNGNGDAFSCYLCTHCGKGFSTENDLKHHFTNFHEQDKTIIDNASSPCSVSTAIDDAEMDDEVEKDNYGTDRKSPSVFSNFARRSFRRIRQNDSFSYCCKLCPRTFSTSSMLNVHYTHTHRDKPQYDCEICGQAFAIKRELATHRRLHDGQPTHRCQQCGKEFGTKQLLRKHELWHTGISLD